MSLCVALGLGAVSVFATPGWAADDGTKRFPTMRECFEKSSDWPEWVKEKSPHYGRMLQSIRAYHSNKRIIEGGAEMERFICQCSGSAISWEEAETLIPDEYRDVSNPRQYLFEMNRVRKLNRPLLPQMISLCTALRETK